MNNPVLFEKSMSNLVNPFGRTALILESEWFWLEETLQIIVPPSPN